MRGIIIIVTVLLLFAFTPPAKAAICRTVGEHHICLLDIQRSAKYYWQYWVIAQVDGEKQPKAVYNCRTSRRTTSTGKTVPFAENGVGELVCRLAHR
ncbi:hypothetical protein PN462_16685 [Spirulina sp. CS-785/01]|uniref:hypothetical protein n=1 Tax=Spirulina sp. CS-785/01 TaxID=3021716 RepID=UPI00232CCDB0|nr:hypothetical protein [Spirulina sp. CS-785/01]MDB9314752.1 hypothetical protein [Spirulina sp. CS-785/01]